jgi:hypothetical protein
MESPCFYEGVILASVDTLAAERASSKGACLAFIYA